MTRNSKIVMVAMFKNEAPVLRRMLDSTLGYCDYYVMQNNGSTDGSDEIAQQFLTENNLSGEVYVCEEGWKGFGWNRDHLVQYCQSIDHGCDWILKMDCDEVLFVGPEHDWAPLEDKSIDSFHITAVSGSTIYYRCWLWNADRKWAFYHDPAHETIYMVDPPLKEDFQRVNLPPDIRQIGFNEGQSWSVPTKFVSDALVLEEKLIREQTMLEDTYHFWYVGKSYADAYACESFPLGNSQQREFARRCIYYFDQYKERIANGVDELAYFSTVLQGHAYAFLDDYSAALQCLWDAERWVNVVSHRNEHLLAIAEIAEQNDDYETMLEATTIMVGEQRTNPFPNMMSFVDNNAYIDTSEYPKTLHNRAMFKPQTNIFEVNYA